MKKYTLQTVTDTGELVKESALEFKKGSVLIVQPKTETNVEVLGMIHEWIVNDLQDEKNVITIPEFIELKVLDIKE